MDSTADLGVGNEVTIVSVCDWYVCAPHACQAALWRGKAVLDLAMTMMKAIMDKTIWITNKIWASLPNIMH
jgi:acetyl-CoA carboxylase alpha subunit